MRQGGKIRANASNCHHPALVHILKRITLKRSTLKRQLLNLKTTITDSKVQGYYCLKIYEISNMICDFNIQYPTAATKWRQAKPTNSNIQGNLPSA